MYRAGRDLGPLGGKWLVLMTTISLSPGSWWQIRLHLQVLSSFLERQELTSTRAPSCLETNPLRRNRRSCGSENKKERGADICTPIAHSQFDRQLRTHVLHAYTEGNICTYLAWAYHTISP
jgi:hypothetical protein